MSEWISVNTALPPYGEHVFVWNGGRVAPAFRQSTDARGEHWMGPYDPSRDSSEVHGVTHWMPLPEPPK